MANAFTLTQNGYYKNHGVNIMVFNDFYPSGHQSGIGLIMNGHRIATNGDIRFEPTPGQWQPTPKLLEKKTNDDGSVDIHLTFNTREGHLRGFNPMLFPELGLDYTIKTTPISGGVQVKVFFDEAVPERYAGKLFFNMELYPGILFGEPWIMDDDMGTFPRQPNGPVMQRESNYKNTLETEPLPDARADRNVLVNGSDKTGEYNPIIADDMVSEPYACGHTFTACPQNTLRRFTVKSEKNKLMLFDGRMNHNNGWFVLCSEIPTGETGEVLVWDILPNVDQDWKYEPVIQVSQVGYHPDQPKMAVIEMDTEYTAEACNYTVNVEKITAGGPVTVLSEKPSDWGDFLRYHYCRLDFTKITEPGLYRVEYRGKYSSVFKIAKNVYERGVWQPVMEYFLPVQMCHMRVQEKYRVWHGLCHTDDAVMAPAGINHIDGYEQPLKNYTKYNPGDAVPGLNKGGWHDAGDFDLRVESQSGEVYYLALAATEFGAYVDSSTIDQKKQVVEIHQPDGNNDILEQIEHGLLTVIGGYKALGRLYRGIICPILRQYVLLGDPVNMTAGAGKDYDETNRPRWVFTENNPKRELEVASHLAAAYVAIKDFRPELAAEALQIAKDLYETAGTLKDDGEKSTIIPADMTFSVGENLDRSRIQAAVELYIATGDEKYLEKVLSLKDYIKKNLFFAGWMVARIWDSIPEGDFKCEMYEAYKEFNEKLQESYKETPYEIPFKPHIWGAGWVIQGNAVRYYFLHKAMPEIFGKDMIYHSLDFILGTHPGLNTASFACGVGTKSETVAYGMNRADWSYIPGGVVSGVSLIQPDFPELLEFPFLWQQSEYVLGGGSTNYMLLVLAAMKIT